MIHDLELETVVDVQGTLTPVFTDEDKAKIDEARKLHKELLLSSLLEQFFFAEKLSERLAVIDIMRELEHPNLEEYIKRLQDEL